MSNISNERIKELENCANDFFVSKYFTNQVIGENLDIYYALADLLCKNLPEFKNKEGYDFDPHTFSRKTPLDNIEIVKAFYKMYGINFDVDKVVSDGTIELNYSNYKYISRGRSYYENGHKLIESYNNGIVTDSIVLGHELSHLRNQMDKGRNVTNCLLTETIAYTEQFIFLDYLEHIGYEYEANIYRKYLYNIFVNHAKEAKVIFKMGDLFKHIGSFSKYSYQFYFGNTDNYDKEIEDVDKYVKNSGNPEEDANYIMAYVLSVYMYYEYRKNPMFMNNIQKLHELINTEDILVCFRSINLNGLSSSDMKKFEQALCLAKEDLEKIDNKKIPRGI